jgi:hypothetical protein
MGVWLAVRQNKRDTERPLQLLYEIYHHKKQHQATRAHHHALRPHQLPVCHQSTRKWISPPSWCITQVEHPSRSNYPQNKNRRIQRWEGDQHLGHAAGEDPRKRGGRGGRLLPLLHPIGYSRHHAPHASPPRKESGSRRRGGRLSARVRMLVGASSCWRRYRPVRQDGFGPRKVWDWLIRRISSPARPTSRPRLAVSSSLLPPLTIVADIFKLSSIICFI